MEIFARKVAQHFCSVKFVTAFNVNVFSVPIFLVGGLM